MVKLYDRVFARRDFAAIVALAPVALCLGGCVEDDPVALAVSSPATSSAMTARPGVSPRGAPLAIVSVEGAPDAISQRFQQAITTAAASGNVAIADISSAAYAARGYLSAYPVDSGTAFLSIWDLYDGSRRRAQRLQDLVVVRSSADDPWSLLDDRILAALATRSANDIAAALTNTPEAIAASGRGAVVATDPAPQPRATVVR